AIGGRGRALLARPRAEPVRGGRGQAGPQGDLLEHRTRAGVLAGPRDRRVPAAGDHAGVPGERGLLAPTTRGEELMRVAALAMLTVLAASVPLLAAPSERNEPLSGKTRQDRQPPEKRKGGP